MEITFEKRLYVDAIKLNSSVSSLSRLSVWFLIKGVFTRAMGEGTIGIERWSREMLPKPKSTRSSSLDTGREGKSV